MSRFACVVFVAVVLSACSTADGTDPAERLGSSQEELREITPGPSAVYGIDVSHFQGTINWASHTHLGHPFTFAFASVGDGLYQDPNFAGYWAAMRSAGVIRGAYQFFRPNLDPIAQANIMIARIGKLGVGDLPAAIDVEVSGGMSSATIAARVKVWLTHVEAATGRRPFIYTGPFFWQDNVGSTAFGAYPLWIADYRPSLPRVPSGWNAFKIWQYSDGNHQLDLDRFNGSLAELKALATPPNTNTAPGGKLEGVDCVAGITGWAQDKDAPTTALGVNLSFDGAANAAGAQGLAIVASQVRKDLCTPLGSCNHGFALPVPRGLRNGKPHPVFAYGLDTAKGANALLTNAPRSFTCAPAEPPLDPVKGVKRLVAVPAVFGAWKFSTLTDVSHYDQPRVDAYPAGDDLPAAPQLLIADGAPQVWIVDGGKRRHVSSPESMAAWRFAAPTKKSAAEIQAIPEGPDWRVIPFLVQGSAPAIYALDLSPATPPGTEEPGEPASVPPSTPSTPSTPPASQESPAAEVDDASGGCQLTRTRAPSGGSTGVVGLVIAALLSTSRRIARRRSAQTS